jgi:hypothetical protein
MLKINAMALMGALSVCGVAHADFVMLAPPTTPLAGDSAPPSAPLDIRPDPHVPKRQRSTISARKAAGVVPVANGFGQSVPLAFAVRQIVPPKIKVSYGPTADRDALVTWRGGRKWTLVLRDAVRPLGLSVTLKRSSVTIGK